MACDVVPGAALSFLAQLSPPSSLRGVSDHSNSMNSNTHADNASPRAMWDAQKRSTVKSFAIGDLAKKDNFGESFTSPILKATQKHLQIDDYIDDSEPSKRRKRNPWTKQVCHAAAFAQV